LTALTNNPSKIDLPDDDGSKPRATNGLREAAQRLLNSARLEDVGLWRVGSHELRALETAVHAHETSLSQAARDVIAERQRQVTEFGWTPEHDDEHDCGQLARAAHCYAYEASRTDHQRAVDAGNPPPAWPWEDSWWKPKDRRQDLVRAGALILAEIERLDRARK
jgi:hypothetical protein